MKTISYFGLCYYICLSSSIIASNPIRENYNQYLDHPAVRKFREYLQIDTSQERNIAEHAVDFIKRQAYELGIPFTMYETRSGKRICIITLEGQDPNLPSIMLNSHMDVVPAAADEWKYPPFNAQMDEEGNIYARGAQDTKDVAIQYLEAIKNLMQTNTTLLRTVHVTFMPDEETGGHHGILEFIDTEEFRKLNIGLALDEGLVTDSEDHLLALYQDRRPWQMEITVHGQGGHGYTISDKSAMENAYKMLQLIMNYREEQKAIQKSRNNLDFGAYTSVNVNMLKAGVAVNMIPSKVIVSVDMRLGVDSKISDVENRVKSWLDAAGNNTRVSFIRRIDRSDKTSMDDSNPFWVAMERALTNIGKNVRKNVSPATSDMLPIRNLGIPAIGFSAKTATVSRIHNKDEYLNVKTFLNGIHIYYEVIKAIANVG